MAWIIGGLTDQVGAPAGHRAALGDIAVGRFQRRDDVVHGEKAVDVFIAEDDAAYLRRPNVVHDIQGDTVVFENTEIFGKARPALRELCQAELCEGAIHCGLPELELGPEVVGDQTVVDTGSVGDLSRRRAVEPHLGEGLKGRAQDQLSRVMGVIDDGC